MPKIINLSKEATTEKNVLRYLNGLPYTKAVKWSQEGRQKGNPDIICCHHGIMILIELKREGEVQELLQIVTMDEWKAVGCITCVATKLEHVKAMMDHIMLEESIMMDELNEKEKEDN